MKKIFSISRIILSLSLTEQAFTQPFIPQEHFIIDPRVYNNNLPLPLPIPVTEKVFGFSSFSFSQQSAITVEFLLGTLQALGTLACGALSLGFLGSHGIPAKSNVEGWCILMIGIALSASFFRLSVDSFSRLEKILRGAEMDFERNKTYLPSSFLNSSFPPFGGKSSQY